MVNLTGVCLRTFNSWLTATGNFSGCSYSSSQLSLLGIFLAHVLSSLLILAQETMMWHRQALSLDFIQFPLSFGTVWTNLKWTLLSDLRHSKLFSGRKRAHVESLCVVLRVQLSYNKRSRVCFGLFSAVHICVLSAQKSDGCCAVSSVLCTSYSLKLQCKWTARLQL